jgi:thiamine biosynthesis lipoprotein
MAEHRVEQIMGMPIAIDVRDDIDPTAIEEAFTWFRRVDATFSTYKPDSDISRLDRGELSVPDAHPHVREVLARCEELRAETNGYFDIHATGRLDPSGYVKGWAVDRAAGLLERAGARRFHINAGGDILARGGTPDPWRIGIQHPICRDRLACVLEITDGAVATSGAYERGAHVFDPHLRRPPDGVLSVTLIGRDLVSTDAYATAAFAMGRAGPAWTASLRSHEAMTILENRRTLSTAGFPTRTTAAAGEKAEGPPEWRRAFCDYE